MLDGALGQRARETVRLVEAALAREAPPDAPGLTSGNAGLALFHAYAGRAADVDAALDAAIDAVASVPLGGSLYVGFPGVAWAVEHLRGGAEDANEEVDAVLVEHLDDTPWTSGYDLVSGLAGLGVYAIERLRARGATSSAAAVLARVLDRLEESAERTAEGITWHTPPALVPAWQGAPEGYYNLGLAHGVPGVVAMLGAAIAIGAEAPRARALIEPAVRWVLAQALPEGFPSWVGTAAPPRPARDAWCYGDPGVAAALLVAGRAAGEPAWERAAIATARRVVMRPFAKSGIRDAGLCHGAAGVAHVLNRIAQATGDEAIAEGARTMFARALDMQQPGVPVAGFPSAELDAVGGPIRWVRDAGLLTGAAGVGLALAAATSDRAPDWDRMLLISAS